MEMLVRFIVSVSVLSALLLVASRIIDSLAPLPNSDYDRAHSACLREDRRWASLNVPALFSQPYPHSFDPWWHTTEGVAFLDGYHSLHATFPKIRPFHDPWYRSSAGKAWLKGYNAERNKRSRDEPALHPEFSDCPDPRFVSDQRRPSH